MDEFRFVGPTPTTLEGGRPIEPGEYTGPILASEVDEETGDPLAPANKILLDEGFLIIGSPPVEPEEHKDKAKARGGRSAEGDKAKEGEQS